MCCHVERSAEGFTRNAEKAIPSWCAIGIALTTIVPSGSVVSVAIVERLAAADLSAPAIGPTKTVGRPRGSRSSDAGVATPARRPTNVFTGISLTDAPSSARRRVSSWTESRARSTRCAVDVESSCTSPATESADVRTPRMTIVMSR